MSATVEETATLIGTFSKRRYAEREGLSIREDLPEGETVVLRVNDDASWSLWLVEA